MAAKEEVASQMISKTMYGCTVESLLTKHEDRIACKGFTSMTHYNLVHKFVPMPQAMKIPVAKAAVDKEWKNSRQAQHGNWRKSEGGFFSKHKERQRKSTLLQCWTYVTSKTQS